MSGLEPSQVAQLVAMGFDAEAAQRALAAGDGVVSNAVDLLVNGGQRGATAEAEAAASQAPYPKPAGTSPSKAAVVGPESVDCVICTGAIQVRGVLDCCDHVFCFECIFKWSETANTCPCCKRRFYTLTKRSWAPDAKASDETAGATTTATTTATTSTTASPQRRQLPPRRARTAAQRALATQGGDGTGAALEEEEVVPIAHRDPRPEEMVASPFEGANLRGFMGGILMRVLAQNGGAEIVVHHRRGAGSRSRIRVRSSQRRRRNRGRRADADEEGDEEEEEEEEQGGDGAHAWSGATFVFGGRGARPEHTQEPWIVVDDSDDDGQDSSWVDNVHDDDDDDDDDNDEHARGARRGQTAVFTMSDSYDESDEEDDEDYVPNRGWVGDLGVDDDGDDADEDYIEVFDSEDGGGRHDTDPASLSSSTDDGPGRELIALFDSDHEDAHGDDDGDGDGDDEALSSNLIRQPRRSRRVQDARARRRHRATQSPSPDHGPSQRRRLRRRRHT